MTTARTYTTSLVADGSMSAIPVPFDARAVFGKVRAPVVVTINGYSYRSTISSMGGSLSIPLRKSNREAAAITHDGPWEITLALDEAPRTVDLPDGIAEALRPAWDRLSFTHQREWAEAIADAKRSETRERRLAALTAALESK